MWSFGVGANSPPSGAGLALGSPNGFKGLAETKLFKAKKKERIVNDCMLNQFINVDEYLQRFKAARPPLCQESRKSILLTYRPEKRDVSPYYFQMRKVLRPPSERPAKWNFTVGTGQIKSTRSLMNRKEARLCGISLRRFNSVVNGAARMRPRLDGTTRGC